MIYAETDARLTLSPPPLRLKLPYRSPKDNGEDDLASRAASEGSDPLNERTALPAIPYPSKVHVNFYCVELHGLDGPSLYSCSTCRHRFQNGVRNVWAGFASASVTTSNGTQDRKRTRPKRGKGLCIDSASNFHRRGSISSFHLPGCKKALDL